MQQLSVISDWLLAKKWVCILMVLAWERSEQATLVLSAGARKPHTGSRRQLVWVMCKYRQALTDTQSQTGLWWVNVARKQNQALTGHYHCLACHWVIGKPQGCDVIHRQITDKYTHKYTVITVQSPGNTMNLWATGFIRSSYRDNIVDGPTSSSFKGSHIDMKEMLKPLWPLFTAQILVSFLDNVRFLETHMRQNKSMI